MIKKINIRRYYYIFRHKYMTLNNVVAAVALLIALSWIWGSLSVMQRNYDLQKDLELKKRQLQLADVETRSIELENRYYQTREYQELAVRKSLGLVLPGEKVLILPDNTQAAKDADTKPGSSPSTGVVEKQSNYKQWTDFLFGKNSQNVSN